MPSAEPPTPSPQSDASGTTRETTKSPVRRLWWLRGGFWYFFVPLLSFGFLSAVPFFHAALRLRDRRALILGIIYGASGAFYIVLTQVYLVDRPPGGWLSSIMRLLVLLLLLWTIFGAMIQLAGLRRRVYLGVTKDVSNDGEGLDAIDADNPTERKFRVLSSWAGGLIALLFGVLICFAIPAGAIAMTLSGQGNLLVGGEGVQTVVLVCAAFVAVVGLIGWLAVGYNREDRVSVHSAFLVAALIVNVYLGFAVWVISIRLIGAEPAASHPQEFGAMVWWNLADSIPLIDVDSALDWEQPTTEFGPEIGWLFLLQRVVLLLTLARTIQVLVNRWTSSSSSESRPSTTARTEPIPLRTEISPMAHCPEQPKDR